MISARRMYLKQLSPHSIQKSRKSSKSDELPKEPRQYKVVIIGAGGVGKSALTMQYVSNIFLDFHEPTIEDVFQTQTVVDGEPAIVDILDTAGEDEMQDVMNEQFLKLGEAYIGVYSITDPSSFHSLRKQIQTLKRLRNTEKIPLVIVANKLDLFNDREISTMDGISLSREFECPFYETSASNRINVQDAFNGLIRQIHKNERSAMQEGKNELKKPKLKRFRKYVCKKIQNRILV